MFQYFWILTVLLNLDWSGKVTGQRRPYIDYDSPKAIISEYYGNSYYENIRPLSVTRNSDVIVGENTSKGIQKLLFECNANFPIQWIYTGDGVPEISTDTNVKRNTINSITPGEFSASLSILKLTEGHSGNYTCRGTQNRDSLVSFYLFVPGDKIFTSTGNENITFSNRDSLVRIPCSVSHPSVKVTLQKATNGYIDCPLNDSVAFNSKTGFYLRPRDFRDPSGTYVCTAFRDNMVRVIQFNLIGRYEYIRDSNCDPSPCGHNADCHVNSQRRTICTCRAGYSGDPFIECRRTSGSSDPCNPSPCGRYGDCVIRNNLASCTCPPNYIGKPPHCMPSNSGQTTRCHSSIDCGPSDLCIDHQCTNQCEKRCGDRAECSIVNRTPICSCYPNHVGDPYQECYPTEDLTSPYEQLEERLRPECQLDLECPDSAACIHQKCQSPCSTGICGQGHCRVRNHKVVCAHCVPGDFHCNRFAEIPDSPAAFGGCHQITCGPHSICQDFGGRGICQCMDGHTGSPPNCSPRTNSQTCFGHSGCKSDQICVNRKCQNPCDGHNCGINSRCVVSNRKPECQCPSGHIGDPKVQCRYAATLLQPSCHLRCGPGARCQFVDNQPMCRCLNPFDSNCQDDNRPNTRETVDGSELQSSQSCFNDEDCPLFKGCFNGQCKNPCLFFKTLCGQNQECQPVQHKGSCECMPGFPHRINNDCFRNEFGKERNFGDISDSPSHEEGVICEPPFCRVGESRFENNRCRFDGDCSSKKKCVNGQCIDNCVGFCGVNAVCTVEQRLPRCSCPLGFFGSPKIRCFPLFRHVKTGEGSSDGKDVIVLMDSDAKSTKLSTNSTEQVKEEEKFGGVLAKKIIAEAKSLNNSSLSGIRKTGS